MRRRAAVAIVLVAAAVASGVAVPLLVAGGGKPRLTKAQYSQRVTGIYRTVDRRLAATQAWHTSRQASASLRAMKAALDRAAAALRRLRPPRDAEQDHRLLVGATGAYAAQVDLVRASVDFGDPATIVAHLRDVTAPAAIRRVLRDLNDRGYRIPVTVASVR